SSTLDWYGSDLTILLSPDLPAIMSFPADTTWKSPPAERSCVAAMSKVTTIDWPAEMCWNDASAILDVETRFLIPANPISRSKQPRQRHVSCHGLECRQNTHRRL